MKPKEVISTGVSVILLCLAIVGILLVSGDNAISTQVKGLFTHSPQAPEATPLPIQAPKENKPSERALRAAMYFPNIIGSKAWQEGINKNFSSGPTSDPLTNFALYLDDNTNALTHVETLIDRYKAQVSQSQSYGGKSAQDNQVNDLQGQLDRQKRELEDLKSDFRWDCIRAGGSPIGNSCL